MLLPQVLKIYLHLLIEFPEISLCFLCIGMNRRPGRYVPPGSNNMGNDDRMRSMRNNQRMQQNNEQSMRPKPTPQVQPIMTSKLKKATPNVTKNVNTVSNAPPKQENVMQTRPVNVPQNVPKNNVSPQRMSPQRKQTIQKPKPQLHVSPAKSTRSNVSASSVASTRSTRSASSRSSRRSKQIALCEKSKKYLDMRKQSNIKEFLIKKPGLHFHPMLHSVTFICAISDNKNLHDVASVKTELTKRIAANQKIDESAGSNEYYYNKHNMLDFGANVDFNAMNDKSVEVINKDKKIKSTAEVFNPTLAAAAANAAQPLGVTADHLYAQDNLPTIINPYTSAFTATQPPVPSIAVPAATPYDRNSPTSNSPKLLIDANAAVMAPTHAPGLEQGNIAEPFPGMLPGVPLETDPQKIQKNAAVADKSELSPMVNDFVPGNPVAANAINMSMPQALNSQFQFGAQLPQQNIMMQTAAPATMTQFAPPQILQYNGLHNPQWLAQQNQTTQHLPAPTAQQTPPYLQPNATPFAPSVPNTQPPQTSNDVSNQNDMGFQQHSDRNQPNRYNNNQRYDSYQQRRGRNRGDASYSYSSRGRGRGYNNERDGNRRGRGDRRGGYRSYSIRGGRGDRRGGGRGGYNSYRNPQRDRPYHQQNNYDRPRQSNQPNDYNNQQQPQQQQQQDTYNYTRNSYGSHSNYNQQQPPRQDQLQQNNQGPSNPQHTPNNDQIPQLQTQLNASILPKWCGVQKLEELLENGRLPQDIYLNFLCSSASDAVFECLGFREIIKGGLSMFLCKRMRARIHGTAPVFSKLSINDFTLSLDGGAFIKYIGNGDVFTQNGLFAYCPLGLKQLEIRYSKSLNDWLKAIPWDTLQKYLQMARNLDSVTIGSFESQNNINDSNETLDWKSMRAFMALFSSLTTCRQFIVESSPRPIDQGFICSLSSNNTDLQLYDKETIWSDMFMRTIVQHFGRLDRFGYAADKMNMPLFVSCMEMLQANNLIIKNVDKRNRQTLQSQDLAMLFSRFAKIEIDASLITTYPTKIHSKVQHLSIKADDRNFFIKLLKNVPSSVNHLSIKNMLTAMTNTLVIDVSQINKFNTKKIKMLELDGFSNNLRGIANVLNHNIFPSLTRLNIITSKKGNNKKENNKKNRNNNNNNLNIKRELLSMIKGQNKTMILNVIHQ